MTKIIIGTTPTITYKFKVVDVSEITVAILTIKERGVNIIELNLSDATVGEETALVEHRKRYLSLGQTIT